MGGSLQKDVQETVHFLVCEKQIVSSILTSDCLLLVRYHRAGKVDFVP